MERLGVFGGTFDPPHLGHLILAAEAAFQLNLDKVLWVLTPHPPHKPNQPITSLEYRIAMVNVAISNNSLYELSDVDINRPSPHYAVDTVTILKKNIMPGCNLVYLIGGDSLANLHTWHDPQELINQIDELGVMARPGFTPGTEILSNKITNLAKKLRWIQTPQIDISSSYIRKLIREGGPFRYYLPDSVYQLIQNQSIYLKQK